MYRSILLGSYYFEDITVATRNAGFGLGKFFAYAREPFSIVANFLYSRYTSNWASSVAKNAPEVAYFARSQLFLGVTTYHTDVH